MKAADILAVRVQMSAQIAKKAEAMRLEAERECYRYEGAFSALGEVGALVEAMQTDVQALTDSAEDLAPLKNKMAALVEVSRQVGALLEASKTGLQASRGRTAQCEQTMQMLKAVFDADQAAAQVAYGDGDEARHPGPSVANQRRNEAPAEGGAEEPHGADT